MPGCATPLSRLFLHAIVGRWLDANARAWLQPEQGRAVDFTQPPGEAALVGPSSLLWRVFKSPVAVFVGGVAAVILELAEPRVRTGVWEHSSFRTDPVRRLQRTGTAAMVTVYGARSTAERMVAGVVRLHEGVQGSTPAGLQYRANDPALLRWVQATAAFGFAHAYSRYVHLLSPAEFDQFYAEGECAARLYGASQVPVSAVEMDDLFAAMRDRLEPSPAVPEFLRIMQNAPVFPAPLRPVQRMLVRAAVEITPGWVRHRLGLSHRDGLWRWEEPLVRWMGSVSDQLVLPSSPAVLACLRLSLSADHLYRS